MSGILFIASLVAVVLICYWASANDRARSGQGLHGLLAMKPYGEEDAEAPPEGKSGRAPKWKKPGPARSRAARKPAAPKLGGQPRWTRQLSDQRER
jgi:hypothetical protein